MRVLHVVWSLLTGGIETMLIDIANEQAQNSNMEVGVLIMNDMVNSAILEKLSKKVRVFRCDRKRGSFSPWPILKFNWYVRKFRPDIVHFHGRDLVRKLKWKGIKVQTLHSSGYKKNDYECFDKLFAISNIVKEEWFPIVQDKVVTIANGIACRNIAIAEGRNKTKGEFHFIQVSRFQTYQKGQDLVLLAIKKIVEKRNDLKFRVHMVGNGNDEGRMKALSKLLHIEEYVVFEGLKDREWVYENLCRFDLFIQASRFEGFGLTVAEACAAKIPVLVSDAEGPLEILDGGRLGLTFKCAERRSNFYENVESEADLLMTVNDVVARDSLSIQDLAEKMLCVLEGRYPYELLDLAYENVVEKYDVSKTAKGYIKEYQSLCGKGI